jgi:heptosyltransferase I
VLDSFLGFADALGIQNRRIAWDIPLPPEAVDHAARLIPDGQPTMVISACSSHRARNWLPGRYAAVAEHAVHAHGMQVILCGGPTALEREMGLAIAKIARVPVLDLVGRDTLPQLLALLARATVLVAPDSGPAHMATMVDTPVIGLYAATNPERSGPYLSRRWCVNEYERAAMKFMEKPAAELPWTTKIEVPGVMELVTVDAVTAKLDELLALDPKVRLQ